MLNGVLRNMLNSICVLENGGISQYLCMAPGLHSTPFSTYCTSKGTYRNGASVYTNGIPICVRLLGVLEMVAYQNVTRNVAVPRKIMIIHFKLKTGNSNN